MKKLLVTLAGMSLLAASSNAATNGTWNGTNGGSWSGSQLQGWTSVSTPATSGSYNAGTIANMTTGAWSLWSETNQSQSRWDFAGGALSTGQSFSMDWRNNSIASGRTITLSLRRSDGTEAFGFRFLGGGTNYEIKGDGTWFVEDSGTSGYQNTAINLQFDLISVNTYVFTATRKSDNFQMLQTGTYGLGGTSGLGLTYFEVYNDARLVGTSDLNFNSITVIPEPSTAALLGLGLGAFALLRRRKAS